MPSHYIDKISPLDVRPFRQRLWELYEQLRTERVSWSDQWRENARFVSPRRPRFDSSRTNDGGRKNRYIIDGAATRGCRTAVAGMAAGITPSSRPWFLLSHPDREIREEPEAKFWLHYVGAEKRSMFSRTNLYQAMPAFYQDLLTFSNAALLVEEDRKDVLRFSTIPIGEWAAANDHRMQCKTFMREFRLTVRQVVEKFCKRMPDGNYDFSNVSLSVKNLFVEGQTENWVDLVHLIMPNDFYDAKKLGFRGKKYLSVYYEYGLLNERPYGDYGGTTGGETMLRIAGYDWFPVLVGRWGLTSGDVYGSWGPTDVAIGDIRELQYFARQQAEASLKQVNPAMVGGSRLKKKGRIPGPGETLWLNDPKSADSLRRIYDFQFDIQHTRELREYIKESINESFYVDLFRRFTSSNRQHMTAKQVLEEQEEKVLSLAPVLELLNSDVLEPLIDIGFSAMQKRGMLPDPPEVLSGQELQIDFVSILHQAQKLLDAGGIERFTGFLGSVAGYAPEILDKLDVDELAERYGDVVSLPPGLLRSAKEVAQIRQQRAAAEQKDAEVDDALAESEVAKNLGNAPIGGGNALELVAENQ